MKIRVQDVGAEAKELSFVEPEEDLNRILDRGPIREYRIDGPISVILSYYRAGTELFFSGSLRAATLAVCARCAEEFAAPVGRNFRFVMTPKMIGFGEKVDLGAEDLEFSLYEGDEVDLSPLIREQLLLSLPTRPLCDQQCRGLCSQCGANLNRGECGCRAERLVSHLTILGALKRRRS